MPPGRFPHTLPLPRPRSRRGNPFSLPTFYLLLVICIISWTATHTTASWDYTTYNKPRQHTHPQRHHSRDTYTPFPGRVVHDHHHDKRNGMAGMGLFEMMGKARGQGVAVTRPLGPVSGNAVRKNKGGGNRDAHSAGGGGGGGRRYGVVRLDDAVSLPVGEMVDDGKGEEELKRGRMVFVEEAVVDE
ncbi:uncharacterized protein QC761_110805 [Podospora bellae-mahoneyi]|uniref:Uncharacterized protein n=1 Tax=Podospora bellae-mahoneyi TaxID=2093777 RepID=A0ABR0FXM5_9PEZI|nr:hypothetical protein QC761_110805 [Podospora bellae-mahoneyi]